MKASEERYHAGEAVITPSLFSCSEGEGLDWAETTFYLPEKAAARWPHA